MRYFIDCEFDGYRGPLISMVLIREDGRGLYFVLVDAEDNAKDPWVITNVLPIVRDCPEAPYTFTRETAASYIAAFMDGDEGPHIVADWPDDLRHFCDLVVYGPGVMPPNLPGFTMEAKRIDAYPSTLESPVQHNAWWDALALRQKVLEMEGAAGEAGMRETRGVQVGDVCGLKSGGLPMTIVDRHDPSGFRPEEVEVAWMGEDGEMLRSVLPLAAVTVSRSA